MNFMNCGETYREERFFSLCKNYWRNLKILEINNTREKKVLYCCFFMYYFSISRFGGKVDECLNYLKQKCLEEINESPADQNFSN